MAVARGPAAVATAATSLTVPEVGACTAAEIKPAASPMTWPRSTVSPFLTVGVAGLPRCCDMETTSVAGSGISTIGCSAASSL